MNPIDWLGWTLIVYALTVITYLALLHGGRRAPWPTREDNEA